MSPLAQTGIIKPTRSLSSFARNLFDVHSRWLNLLTLALVVLLMGIYIFQVNGSISKGYNIRELETQIENLTLLNQTLELEAQQTGSLEHVERNVKMLGLVDGGHPRYVNISEPSYALAE
jgi:hypothetical protein